MLYRFYRGKFGKCFSQTFCEVVAYLGEYNKNSTLKLIRSTDRIYNNQEEYVDFGPTMVLYCRGPVWTLPPKQAWVITAEMKRRPALTRYLTDRYTSGKVTVDVLFIAAFAYNCWRFLGGAHPQREVVNSSCAWMKNTFRSLSWRKCRLPRLRK